MIIEARKKFNAGFTEEKYSDFLQDIHRGYDKKIEFKVAETPVFIPGWLRDMVIDAGERIIDVICDPEFISTSRKAIPDAQFVPGEESRSTFIALDFGICEDENNQLIPKLIELQGFPSLFGWQHILGLNYRKHFSVPADVDHLMSGISELEYLTLLKKTIIADHDPESVILLDVEPEHQKTWIDFYITRDLTGVNPVSITDITKEGKQIFYYRGNKKIRITRIYNRLIFDELLLRKDLDCNWDMTSETDVEWVCHPNWFFRISKYTLPFLKNKFVPETFFIKDISSIPTDLENWVLKPLFSFAGHGVVFDVQASDIEKVRSFGEHFILQRKVKYKPVIETPDIPAKFELRLMYIWEKDKPRPTPVINLARLSKGVMIGVDFNKNKSWVGGTVGYFEK